MTLHISQNEIFADKSQTLTTVRVGGWGIPGKLEQGNTALLLETALVSMQNQMQCKFAPGSARLLKDGGRRGIHTWVFLVIAQGKNERAGKESSDRELCLPR